MKKPSPDQFRIAITSAIAAFYPELQWHADENAPNSWKALQPFKSALHGLGSLPVYNGASEKTIFIDSYINVLFRAWHDAIHLEKGFSFQPEDEIKTAFEHVRQLMSIGVDQTVYEWLFVDIIGQVYFYKHKNQFVENQIAFTEQCFKCFKRNNGDLLALESFISELEGF